MDRFVAVVPIKPTPEAKSRLTGLPQALRRDLAIAFARDVIDAVSATSRVVGLVVATDDPAVSSDPRIDLLVADAGSLNGSLRSAAQAARRRWPEACPAALFADLPCVTPADLETLLGTTGPAFVPDLGGTGSTSYVAPYDVFAPRFGAGSRAAHIAAGAVELAASDRLRRDVDTLDDLRHALALGVGRHTAELLADVVLPGSETLST